MRCATTLQHDSLHVAHQTPDTTAEDSPSVLPQRSSSVSARATERALHTPSNIHASFGALSSLFHKTTMSSFASELWHDHPGRFRTTKSGIRHWSIIGLGALCCWVARSVAIPRWFHSAIIHLGLTRRR